MTGNPAQLKLTGAQPPIRYTESAASRAKACFDASINSAQRKLSPARSAAGHGQKFVFLKFRRLLKSGMRPLARGVSHGSKKYYECTNKIIFV